MNTVAKELFRAIHEGYWLAVEYLNQKNETTRYWIAVKDLNPRSGRLSAEGMHLGKYTFASLNLHLKRIKDAKVIEGTWAGVNEELVADIRNNPEKYRPLFSSSANLQILNYLAECARLDQAPFIGNFTLVDHMDDEVLEQCTMHLNDAQFMQIVRAFQKRTENRRNTLAMKQFGVNLLSLHTAQGKYLLAYQPLRLDVKNRMLSAYDDPVICSQFTIHGTVQTIRRFMNPEYLDLLNHFRQNAEAIREAIAVSCPGLPVDDMPYMIEVCRDSKMNLDAEYEGILQMYDDSDPEAVTAPVRAFFGELTARPEASDSLPLALTDEQVNLDQLTAINHAMRMPVSYVQGPPGTGKTMTIVRTVITAFFNQRTVLLSSFNNHPIDEAVEKLCSLKYHDKPVRFPVLRLGNQAETIRSLRRLGELLKTIEKTKVYEKRMEKAYISRSRHARKLSRYLDRYETKLDLLERKEAAEQLLKSSTQMNFALEIETRQLPRIEKELEKAGEFEIDEALKMIGTDFDQMLSWLYEASNARLAKLPDEKYDGLKRIIAIENDEGMVKESNSWIGAKENLALLLEVFPVIATTCISARRLGPPVPQFDLTILDEASQCNTAVSLVPIIRGKGLMMVGDPQQLQPVILLAQSDSDALRKRYGVAEEYDYCRSSIYKTMLANDAVSDEILLSHHYRCDPKIISFSNKKYYNSRLKLDGRSIDPKPLVYIDVGKSETAVKNTSPKEADAVIDYLRRHPYDNAGIITPFVAQRKLIQSALENSGCGNAQCGTVHAFQGDEKDVILFSLCLSEQTRPETYEWLKNNRELINVSTSRARKKLLVIGSTDALRKLHNPLEDDDLYDLVQYVRTNGACEIVSHECQSRALGIRPYSTETEEAFLLNLNHALDNAFSDGRRYTVHKEVPISQIFVNNPSLSGYFYKGRFDFTVFRKINNREIPVLAIELDGREHMDSDAVKARDEKKEAICREHGFELIRVDNTYARRYHYMKDILSRYFRAS